MEQSDSVIRCPGCGTIVRRDRDNCGVCGADLSQTRAKPLAEAVQEEQESEASEEKAQRRKELHAIRKTVYARLILGVVGVICLIVAIIISDMPPTVTVRFGQHVSIPGITLAFAGFACLSTALWPR